MRIAEYEILDEIGRGDTGVVYHVSDSMGQEFALKIALDNEPFHLMQMKQEAEVLKWLNHPAAPKFVAAFEHEGKNCVLLEYIKGRDFDTILRERTIAFSESEILSWALSLAELLQQIHEAQHIYAYLAPSHIVLSEAGQLYLIDYGKTFAYQPDSSYPALGLAGYSPPEQYVGKQEPRSDVYSLGVFMYHLATLRDPRISHAAFLFHVMPPRSINPSLSIGFERLVLKALEHKASERFESIAAMKAAILACGA
jgi:serine/threonine-protein kinase